MTMRMAPATWNCQARCTETCAIILNACCGAQKRMTPLMSKPPSQEGQHDRDPRPEVVKPDDDGPDWQIQKAVCEGARFPFAA